LTPGGPEPGAARADLVSGLRCVGLTATDLAIEALWRYVVLVLRENRHTNLVGARNKSAMVVHVLDSLAPLADRDLSDPVADLGSGAGLPGIAAAIALPDHNFVLLEARSRRAHFLRTAVAELSLQNVEVVQVRAETAGRGDLRTCFGTVLARAVAKPAVVFELALPLLRLGGELVLYTGRQPRPTGPELYAIRRLGGELEKAKPVAVPYLEAQRHVWILRKARKTPAAFPRRSGVPETSPLTPSDVPRGTKR